MLQSSFRKSFSRFYDEAFPWNGIPERGLLTGILSSPLFSNFGTGIYYRSVTLFDLFRYALRFKMPIFSSHLFIYGFFATYIFEYYTSLSMILTYILRGFFLNSILLLLQLTL